MGNNSIKGMSKTHHVSSNRESRVAKPSPIKMSPQNFVRPCSPCGSSGYSSDHDSQSSIHNPAYSAPISTSPILIQRTKTNKKNQFHCPNCKSLISKGKKLHREITSLNDRVVSLERKFGLQSVRQNEDLENCAPLQTSDSDWEILHPDTTIELARELLEKAIEILVAFERDELMQRRRSSPISALEDAVPSTRHEQAYEPPPQPTDIPKFTSSFIQPMSNDRVLPFNYSPVTRVTTETQTIICATPLTSTQNEKVPTTVSFKPNTPIFDGLIPILSTTTVQASPIYAPTKISPLTITVPSLPSLSVLSPTSTAPMFAEQLSVDSPPTAPNVKPSSDTVIVSLPLPTTFKQMLASSNPTPTVNSTQVHLELASTNFEKYTREHEKATQSLSAPLTPPPPAPISDSKPPTNEIKSIEPSIKRPTVYPPNQTWPNVDVPNGNLVTAPSPIVMPCYRSTRTEPLPFFDGTTPELWISFNAIYHHLKRTGMTKDELIAEISQAVSGRARKFIQDQLLIRAEPDEMIKELEKYFGNSDRILQRLVNDVEESEPLYDLPKGHLLDFALKLKGIVTTARFFDREDYLRQPILCDIVTEKIRLEHHDWWANHKRDNKNATFVDLANYLLDRATLPSATEERIRSHASKRMKPSIQ